MNLITIAAERNEMTCAGRKQEQLCDEDYSVQKCALCSEVLFTSRFGGHLWRLAGDTSKNYLSVHLHELLSDHVLDHHPSHCENCEDEEEGLYVCSSFAPFHLSFALFRNFHGQITFWMFVRWESLSMRLYDLQNSSMIFLSQLPRLVGGLVVHKTLVHHEVPVIHVGLSVSGHILTISLIFSQQCSQPSQ